MRKMLMTLALCGCLSGAFAQETTTKAATTPQPADGRQSPSTGDYFNGLTRPLTFDRMIPPYALEVTFNKTTHVLFPAAICFVVLGFVVCFE